MSGITRGEPDLMPTQDNPLRTASGFVLGIVLSVALWAAAGTLAWYLI